MIVKPITKRNAVIDVPGDKSVTHRAIMFNAVAEGQATVTNALLGEDCLSTIECMRALGATITVTDKTVTVKGAKKLKNHQVLNVGNSGTTIRLLCGLLAGRGISVTIDGDESIRRRPMNRVVAPLMQMGAHIESTDGHAPIVIKPATLHGACHRMTVASAQVKSALILAGLTADGATTVIEPLPCRNHTEIMLSAMSADVTTEGRTTIVRPGTLKSVNVAVAGDISSAAYPMVLATCLEGSSVVIKNVGVNPTRRAIIDVINAHGGRVTLLKKRVVSGEFVSDIMVESGAIRPFDVGGDVIPNLIDEIPILAVMGAAANGRSVIRDAQELKVKESNRIDAVVECLVKMGVRAQATPDGMIIDGTGVIMGGEHVQIDPHGDHRIAMSMAVAAALSVDGAEILNDDVVNVSYPDFYESVLNLKK